MTTVLESAASVPPRRESVTRPASLRIGQLGLGTVGSALARLTHRTSEALTPYGIAALSIPVALVRTASRPRTAAAWVGQITDDPDAFFAEPLDIVVEAIGGVEPAHALVRRALDRGIPVVTANKSLIAAHGEVLSDVARARGTALRYEASCIAGVPFLGTFERRPLASRVRGLTAILNGTSNAILTAVSNGIPFDTALRDAQLGGLAEPDPSQDISGRDAAEKLTLLIRRFAHLLVTPDSLHVEGLSAVDPVDLRAARMLSGTIKPVAHATWSSGDLQAFVGPSFLPNAHPLSRIDGVINGILLDTECGRQCYIGPGAGPDVTAAALLDDICEVAGESCIRIPVRIASTLATPCRPVATGWFMRIADVASSSDAAELLGSYGLWCARTQEIDRRLYLLTFTATPDRAAAAADAIEAVAGTRPVLVPALANEELSC